MTPAKNIKITNRQTDKQTNRQTDKQADLAPALGMGREITLPLRLSLMMINIEKTYFLKSKLRQGKTYHIYQTR